MLLMIQGVLFKTWWRYALTHFAKDQKPALGGFAKVVPGLGIEPEHGIFNPCSELSYPGGLGRIKP